MANVSVTVDRNYLLSVLGPPAVAAARAQIERKVKAQVTKANRKLIQSFLQNAITREIAAGPHSANTSGALGGKGNLFSFLGLEQNDTSVYQLASFLSKGLKVKSIRKGGQLLIVINIGIPTVEDVEDFTQLPWVNKSWVRAIEEGVSGLGHYLYSSKGFDTSRSRTGIQLKKSMGGGSLAPQSFLTEILESVSTKLVKDISRSIGV